MAQDTQTHKKENILDILKRRPIVGDGSCVLTLEKRGCVLGGKPTPEATVQYPEAVEQLHREFLRAGADVLTTFSFNASDSRLQQTGITTDPTAAQVNQAACDLVKRVADPAGVQTAGGISPTPTFAQGNDREVVKAEFRKQCEIFVKNKIDLLLAEFFSDVKETELAIEAMKETGLPVAANMRIGPHGDANNVPPGECAIRMTRAGADIVGVNCSFDPKTCITTLRLMKEALDAEGLHPYLMMQPVGFNCPDAADHKDGHHALPEFPFAMEPRLLTRWEVRESTRQAYELGVRYIGGCCGYEPYHIREIASELTPERGFGFPGEDKYRAGAASLSKSGFSHLHSRASAEYWRSLKPASGRPDCPVISTPVRTTPRFV